MQLSRRRLLSWLAAAGLGGLVHGDSGNVRRKGFFGARAPASPGLAYRDAAGRRKLLYELLGDLPDRQRPLGARLVKEEERDGYILETLELDLNGIEPVPAYFARPREVAGRRPCIVFNHSHGGGYQIGKAEFVDGRSYLQPEPYAKTLTANGWSALAIDHWVFGERSHTSEADMFKAMLWQGHVLWGMMVYDSLRAVDYVISRPDVDAERLGTLGISMGSTMAWWLAALDERIRVTIDICCLSEFHTLLQEEGLRRHGIYYYVPSLLKHFTTSGINALIAPRPHLALAGRKDGLTPERGLDLIERELDKIYGELGVPEQWKLLRYDVAHQETAEGRAEILRFLKRYL
jgi:dienelactone hydrolase